MNCISFIGIVLICVLLLVGCGPPPIYSSGEQVKIKNSEQIVTIKHIFGPYYTVFYFDSNNHYVEMELREEFLEKPNIAP